MKKQAGFTLIELIMVIVILGVLSAFALPRFADLGGEAREASIKGALGAVRSAANIAHAQWLADGDSTATTVVLEGTTIQMPAGSNGYPAADSNAVTSTNTTSGISEAAQLSGDDYDLSVNGTGTVLTVTLGECSFTYEQVNGVVSDLNDTDTSNDGC